MSSWKKAAKAGQKTHWERHQPEVRKHLGLLEKKKDYVARAKDFQEKRATIKLLRKRALNKNPDEFHFHMINSKLENGIHREKKEAEHTPEQIKLMETQDMKYIMYRKHIETKKINKLQNELHMLDTANETPNQHIFFMDDGKEAKNFDLAKRLDTHPALLSRRINRPRMSDLSKMQVPELDEKTLAKLQQKNHMNYTLLAKRLDRERELTIVQQKLEMCSALKDKKIKKPKCVMPGTKHSAPIYKWKYERKR
ncbi:probable U3 small nucleolar RNA-associated protein 11 [Harpegnathos saltator]|uniref:U3 small nucleolar RNA-associated protein 11 n=1 Tax=Harpegnathos saltator TaxID=610380 RepID=E2BPM4_HARSA|nr:probable U3 small nucleolar RNA-associated protein 11 [Harpegnathos saltator]EFN82428.1 Probable U3 small nucleolar RNA-associated protein 11 [Harpegnathos saltator]